MVEQNDNKIRDLAYQLWERDGSPHGKDDDYWHAAEKLLADESEPTEQEDADIPAIVAPAALLLKK